jgi:hypothetical protein
MNQEQLTIGYDEFMTHPRQERLRIFNNVSAENCALLIKTHCGRWLTTNRPRLTPEQIAVAEELIPLITPKWYKADNKKKVERETKVLERKLEAVFSREDVMQFGNANFADYLPPVEDKNY